MQAVTVVAPSSSARPLAKRSQPADEGVSRPNKSARLGISCQFCSRVFDRECDCRKHEKRHTRPHKCPQVDCSYYTKGFPNEAEKDRHVNDKHSTSSFRYRCHYCKHETKRESNLMQHMERIHLQNYRRTKGSGKGSSKPRRSSEQSTEMPVSATEGSAPQESATEPTPAAGNSSAFPTPDTPVLQTPVYGQATASDELMPPDAVKALLAFIDSDSTAPRNGGREMFYDLSTFNGQGPANDGQGQLPSAFDQGQIQAPLDQGQMPIDISLLGQPPASSDGEQMPVELSNQELPPASFDVASIPVNFLDPGQLPFLDGEQVPVDFSNQGQQLPASFDQQMPVNFLDPGQLPFFDGEQIPADVSSLGQLPSLDVPVDFSNQGQQQLPALFDQGQMPIDFSYLGQEDPFTFTLGAD